MLFLIRSWFDRLRAAPRRKRTARRGRRATDDFCPRLSVRRLEERRVMNADAVPVQQLVVDAGAAAGDGQADTYLVEQFPDHLRVSVNGKEVSSTPLDEVGSLHIRGSLDDDILIADFKGGEPLAGLELLFDGRGGHDSLQVSGNASVDQVTYHVGEADANRITIGSGTDAFNIQHREVESIEDHLTAENRSYRFEAGSTEISVEDSASGDDGLSRIVAKDADDLSPDLTLTFQNPTGTLSIETNANAVEADSVQVNTLDRNFDATLRIIGSADDEIVIRGPSDVGSGNVELVSGTIRVENLLSTEQAHVSLIAEREVFIGEHGVILNAEGTVEVESTHIEHHGQVSARGGVVHFDSGAQGQTAIFGVIDVTENASDRTGGTVHVLGGYVSLSQGARINASGAAGGGTVLVGGDYQGRNPLVHNAARTYVAANAAILADATLVGSGGKVVVWADDLTGFFGKIFARGGNAGGDGGLVEVSGKEVLVYQGMADTTAAHGRVGTLLLDPEILNITLANGADNAQINDGIFNSFTNPVDPVVDVVPPLEGFITAAHLVTQLNASDVILQATAAINVLTPVDASAGNDFTLELDAPTINFSPLANILNDGGITIGNTQAGNVVLLDGAAIVLNSAAGGGAINIKGTVSGTPLNLAESLTLNSGAGVVMIGGAVSELANLTITDSAGTTFGAAVTAGTVTITNTSGSVTFADNATINTLVTTNQTYNVAFQGSATTITSDVNFLNTGTVTLGNGAGDSTTFVNGVSATAPSAVSVAGTIAATNAASAITLGDANTGVTVTANTLVGGTATGAIDLGDATINNAVTLTVGTGIANAINLDAVQGVAGGAASNLTLNTTGIVTVAEAVGTDIGTILIAQSGGITFQGAVTSTVVNLVDTTGTITFAGNLTAGTLTTANQDYNVAILGTTNSITANTTFLNTGTVTLGDAAGDSTTFVNGVTVTAPSAISIAGTVAATAAAGAIILGDINTAITLTDNAIITGMGSIATSAINANNRTIEIDSNTTLTLGGNITAASGVMLSADELNMGNVMITSSGNVTFMVDKFINPGTVDAATNTFQIRPLTETAVIQFAQSENNAIAHDVFYQSNFVNIVAGSFIVGGDGHRGDIHLGNGLAALIFNFDLTLINTNAFNAANIVVDSDYNSSAGNGDLDLRANSSIVLQDLGGGATLSINLGTGEFNALGDTILSDNVDIVAGGGITFDGNVDADANGRDLTLNASSSGEISFTGDVGDPVPLANLTITNSAGTTLDEPVTANTVTITDTSGSVTFADNATITTLVTAAQGYNVAFHGTTTTITNNVNFLNTGTVTLGDGAGDSTTFANGVTATAPSAVSVAGTIAATNAASVITLGDANTGMTVTANTLIGGAATGAIDLGDATINDGVTLTVGTGIANIINLDAVQGVAGGATSNLTLNTTGVVTVAEAVGTDIGTIQVTQSGGTTFQGAVTAATVNIADTVDNQSVEFQQNTTLNTLTTAAQGYNIALIGTTNTVAGDTNFLNTGTVTLGNDAGDSTTFAGGLATTGHASNPSATIIAGTVATTNTRMDLGVVTLTQDSTLDTGTAATSILNVGAVTSNGHALTLDSGPNAAADVTVASFAGNGNLTVRDSGGTTFTGIVIANTVTLLDTTGAIVFAGDLTATSLVTANQGYDVAITGTTNTITNDVNFLNTGTVTLGNGAGDSTMFVNGVIATAPSAVSVAGTIAATNAASVITLGDANTGVTVTANTLIGGAATGAIDLGDATINNGFSLTLGTGIANIINLDAVQGVAGGAASNLTFNTTGVVTVAEAVGTDIGTILITQSGGTTFQGAITATEANIVDTQGAVTFDGSLTLNTLTTATEGYDVAVHGELNSVTTNTNFLNAGTVTLGDGAGDSTTFVNGVNVTTPSAVNIAGTIAATLGASAITLGDANTGVTVTANTFVGGAATGMIDLGDATIQDATLTLGTGVANAINLDSVQGVAGGAASNLTLNTTGVVTVAEAVGTDIGTILVTQSGGAAFQDTVTADTVNVVDTVDNQTVEFQQNTTLNTLTTAAQGYNFAFIGGTSNITGASSTTFLNSGTVTLGKAAADSTIFASGVTATAPIALSIAGTIAATNGASSIVLGDVDTGISVMDNSTVGGAATGLIDLGDATINNAFTLTLGTGIANVINLDAVQGVAGGAASNLTLNTTGVVTVAEAVGTDIGTILLTQSGGTTFQSSTNATLINIVDTQGTVMFGGNLDTGTLTTAPKDYHVAIHGTTNTITTSTNFFNTGLVTLGNGGSDSTTFVNGVTATAPMSVHIAGTVAASNDISTIILGDNDTGVMVTDDAFVGGTATGAIDLGDATIENGMTLTVGTGIANVVNLDAVSAVGGGANLTVNTADNLLVAEQIGVGGGTVLISMANDVTAMGSIVAGQLVQTTGTGLTHLQADVTTVQQVNLSTAQIKLHGASEAVPLVVKATDTADGMIVFNVADDSVANGLANLDLQFVRFVTRDAATGGQISDAAINFLVLNNSKPLVFTPLSVGQNKAEISVVVDDPFGLNFHLTIDWKEPEAESPPTDKHPSPTDPPPSNALRTRYRRDTFSGSAARMYQHEYVENPNVNPTDDIIARVHLTGFAQNTVKIFENDRPLVDALSNPNQIGIFVDLVIDVGGPIVPSSALPTPEPLPAGQPRPPIVGSQLAAVAQPFNQSAARPIESSAGTASEAEQRYYELRIVSFAPDGSLIEVAKQSIDLSSDQLKAIHPFDLSKLPELFGRLPADRYRIYLIEDGSERLVLDFIIQEGQPIDASELEAAPADGENLDPIGAEPLGKLLPGDDLQGGFVPIVAVQPARGVSDVPLTVISPELRRTAPDSNLALQLDWSIEPQHSAAPLSFAERLGSANYFAHGTVVIGAAALTILSNSRRAKSMDRLMERFGDRRCTLGRRRVPAASKHETTNKDSRDSIPR